MSRPGARSVVTGALDPAAVPTRRKFYKQPAHLSRIAFKVYPRPTDAALGEIRMKPADKVPCLKGSILVLMVKGVKILLREGRVRREELEAELEASDMELLSDKILPGGWYPMGAFDRFAHIVKRHFGAGQPEFLVEQGRIAAEQLIGGEIYGQYADRALSDRERGGKMMVALSSVLFNFSKWSIGPGEFEDEHVIEVREAEGFADSLRYAGEGFIAVAATRLLNAETRVRSERPEPDRILFRIAPA